MVDLLEDVAPSSNEIGAVADLAQQMLDLEDEILRLEELIKEKKRDLARRQDVARNPSNRVLRLASRKLGGGLNQVGSRGPIRTRRRR